MDALAYIHRLNIESFDFEATLLFSGIADRGDNLDRETHPELKDENWEVWLTEEEFMKRVWQRRAWK